MSSIKIILSNIKNSNMFAIINLVLFIVSLIVIILYGKALEGFVGLIAVFVLVITTVFLIDTVMSKL